MDMNMAPNDVDIAKLAAFLESLQRTVVSLEAKVDLLIPNLTKVESMQGSYKSLEAKVDALTNAVNDLRIQEAKRNGDEERREKTENRNRWLVGIVAGVAGVIISNGLQLLK
jgi:hypothetical protein